MAQLAKLLDLPSSTLAPFLKEHAELWKHGIELGMVLDSPDGVIWDSVVEGGRYKLYSTPRFRYVQEDGGELLRLSEWCKRNGVAIGTINFRLAAGWGLDDAMTRAVEVPIAAREVEGHYGWPPMLRQAWGDATKPGRWECGCFGKEMLAGA